MAYQPRRFQKLLVNIDGEEVKLGTIELPRGNGDTTTPRIDFKQELMDDNATSIYLVGFNYYDFDSYCGMFEIVNSEIHEFHFFDSKYTENDTVLLDKIEFYTGQQPYKWYAQQVERRLQA